MKKVGMLIIGIALFVAGYQHIRRQKEYITAQSARGSTTTYAETPPPTSASPKRSLAFRLIKPS
ncbi:hypothetical protein [Spirosoma arcticum]